MNRKTKIICMFAFVIALQIIFPISTVIKENKFTVVSEASTVKTWNISKTENDNVKATLDSNGTLIISGTGEMKDFNYNNADCAEWHNPIEEVTKIVINEGVTSIGKRAFMRCSKFTEINIPASVTSVGTFSFDDCESLTKITINGNFSCDTSVFIGSNNITTLHISKSVTEISGNLLSSLDALTTITIDSKNTAYKVNGGILYSYDMKTLIGCPAAKTGKVTIPSGVQTIESIAFQGCRMITDVSIPNTVTTIGRSAFNMCYSLKSVYIPGSVKNIPDYAFMQCSELETVELGEGVEKVGDCAFSSCYELKTIKIPSTLTSIDSDAIDKSEKIQQFIVNANNTTYCTVDGSLFSKDKKRLIRYASGKTATTYTIPSYVETLADSAFYASSNLKKVVFNDKITVIPEACFMNCEGLEEVTIPNTITKMGNACYRDCDNLKNVVIGERVATVGATSFYYCEKLETVEFKSGVNSIGNAAFEYCNSLTNMCIPSSVTYIGSYAFSKVKGPVYYYANHSYMQQYAEKNSSQTTFEAKSNLTLKSISVKTLNEKLYIVGDKFDKNSIAVKAKYDDNKTREVFNYSIKEGDTIKAGQTSVTIVYSENGVEKKAVYNIAIARPLESISLNKTSLRLEVEKSSTLTVTYNPTDTTDSKTVTWTSSKTSVANVDSNGNIKAVSPGSATITAVVGNKTAKCTVTVVSGVPFKDVPYGSWYYNAVKFVYDNNIIKGYDSNTFAPDDKLTRGMIVTILWRMEGSPKNDGKSKFTDVNSSEWYAMATKWAADNGIVRGYAGTTKFGPNDNIIRQDLAGILRNYAKLKGKNVNVTSDLSKFSDYKSIDSYANASMQWAVGKGVITGNANGTLNPKGTATRAEAAAMIQKYINKVGR